MFHRGWSWTTVLHIINFMLRSGATIAPEPEKDPLVFHGVEVDHCSTYYLLYAQKRSRNCTIAGEGRAGFPRGGGGPL